MNIDPAAGRGGGDITIVDDTALLPEEGPSGTIADIEKPKNATISLYIVREGDTLSEIAQMFDVSPSTILWANDLPAGAKLRVGQQLTILPITSLPYTVKKGDTIASIAQRFNGDPAEIAAYNGLTDSTLLAGVQILIPNGEAAAPAKAAAPAPARKSSATTAKAAASASSGGESSASSGGYYIAPLAHYVRTQGIHGYNGVDLAAPVGTPILAAAEGDVIVAKGSGYNGGYGEYVVIQHGNGSQTLYAHQSDVEVGVGQHVVQGQVIGYVGTTGKSTGPHVHFEIRNGTRNPF